MATPCATNQRQTSNKHSTANASVSNSDGGYVILLSGTHVTGKETIAFSLAQSLQCQWIKGEAAHAAANFGARAQASRRAGYDYHDVFQRIWLAKMLRLGLDIPSLSTVHADRAGDGMIAAETANQTQEIEASAGGSRADTGHQDHKPKGKGKCLAVITIYATRYPARKAVRSVLAKHFVKPIFAILQITKQTLSGRTLGAEEAELAKQIMREKERDIEPPEESELLVEFGKDHSENSGDILVVESDDGRSVDELFRFILKGVQGIMSS
ncbi:putative thermosensitive gluconokinase [Rhypophila sp. PSN 637]